MAVQTTKDSVRYTGDGVTTTFPLVDGASNIPFFEAGDWRVFLDGVLQSSGFSISSNNLIFDTAPSDTVEVFARRVLGLVQDKEYPTNDTFPSESHEAALDRLTMISQQQSSDIGKAARFAETSDLDPPILPTPVDGRAIKWSGVAGEMANTDNDVDEVVATATTQAGIATTQAGIATTQAGISTTQAGNSEASAIVSQSWAIDPIGDRPEGSAKYWAEQAEAFAASIDLPDLGAANTVLKVNAGGTDLEYGKIAFANAVPDEFATAAQGALADTALQPAGDGSGLTNMLYIGVGQTWQDVSGSRSLGTTYTNSTDRPIQIIITQGGNSGTFVVDGFTVTPSASNTSSIKSFYSAIIPDGATYSLTGGNTPDAWIELR